MLKHRVRVGVHARNDVNFPEQDYALVHLARIETVKTMSFTEASAYERLRRENPGIEFIVRLYDDRIRRDSRPSPADFVARMLPIINRLKPYASKFEIHNEPNHADGIEGWGAGDENARAFRDWYRQVLRALKAACPWAEYGFPGLALNYPHRDLEWLDICHDVIHASDWLGCHCYWQYGNMLKEEWGLRFQLYHQRFPDKRVEVTEFGNSTPNLPGDQVAREYAEYYQQINKYPYLSSASAFIASSPDPTWAPFVWVKEGGEMLPVVQAIRNMPRKPVEIPTPVPAPAPKPQQPAQPIPAPYRTFPQTGKTVRGTFLKFLDQYGLDICGYPITDSIKEDGKPAQYFQRVALEEVESGKIRLKPLGAEVWTARAKMAQLQARVQELQERLLSGAGPAKPTIQDLIGNLATHPTKQFPSRSLIDLSQIVIHHTATSPTLTPQRLAQYQVEKLDKPGITYHFFIAADGTIYQTNRLETATDHAYGRSQNSIGVCFPGNFTEGIPTAAQIDAGGQLCAWLLGYLRLPATRIAGLCEFVSTQSPGLQWLGGQRWKDKLMAEVEAALETRSEDQPMLIATLRERIKALQYEIQQLKEAAPPVSAESPATDIVGKLSDLVESLQGQVRVLHGELVRTQAKSKSATERPSTWAEAPDTSLDTSLDALSDASGNTFQDTSSEVDHKIMQRAKRTILAEIQAALETQGDEQAALIAALQARIVTLQEELEQQNVQPAADTPVATAESESSIAKPDIQDVTNTLIRHSTKEYETRSRAAIKSLVIHHSAVPSSVGPQQIANYHVKQLGWPGIGYHFLVAADGTLYRANPVEAVTRHALAVNATGVGICFLGNFTQEVPPPAQLKAGAHLVAWLMQELHVSLDDVKGHRDLMQTECPGNQWLQGKNWRKMLRQRIAKVQEDACQPIPVPPACAKPIYHYMLFWSHEDAWAEQDWLNAQRYIATFRPSAGFSAHDAAYARFVTIVGGPVGVSREVEMRLKKQGCSVDRIAGQSELDTKQILNNLVRQGRRFRSFDEPFAPLEGRPLDASQRDPLGAEAIPFASLWTGRGADLISDTAESMANTASARYQVTLPVFEGPLDLLLHLIERQELDITEVSLAQVTNQYVEYLAELSERDPDNLADFLVVAAKLLLIKSRVLLPQPPASALPEEEDEGADLVRQLIEYKKYKEAARQLEELEALGKRSYIRVGAPPVSGGTTDLNGVTLDDLLAAVRQVYAIKPPVASVNGAVAPVSISIADQMELIEQETAQGQSVSFLRLLERASSRVEIIVTLLALLEMVKQLRVAIRQTGPFGDIVIERKAAARTPAEA